MKVVIVESPTKAKTISRFLKKDFLVESSNGHVRDLPKSELGIDIENNFEPKYVTPKKVQKKVSELKKIFSKADDIILATDEDREGEAIAWHLASLLPKKQKPKRIVFHEITKNAVEKAMESPREIDINLVEAQQARRILDRLVGYKLSPFLWKKLMRGLSAGRVQSVALRLIVEREEEIRAFKSIIFWTISALLNKKGDKKIIWENQLVKINSKAIERPGLTDKKEVDSIIDNLEKNSCEWKIESLETKTHEQRPPAPFTTSTLQQSAWSKLHFSAKKTMMLAQQLYEGIELTKEGGATGLITYMRTDSLNISEGALATAGDYIKNNFGMSYSLPSPKRFKTKSKNAQEAHEAIRPTNPALSPDLIKADLSRDQFRLYELIWSRFIATQMANALFERTTLNTEAKSGDNSYLFQAKGSILKFNGFLKVYPMKTEDIELPDLKKNDEIEAGKISTGEHQTQPPARYNDASLVKILEKHSIGRPSTYASIISTLEARNYIERNETKKFVPTEIGEKVNKMIVEHFPQIVDIDFTAKMENDLDDIATGKTNRLPVIKDFYIPFEKNLAEKYETVEKENLTEKTDEICEKCGKPMVIKHGRFGRFIACSGFPECKTTKRLPGKDLDIKCPLCKDGDVIEKKTKRGRLFYGCSSWPKCDFAAWKKPTGELCQECGAAMVEYPKNIKCSNKNCGNIEIKKPH